jgi:hypothetical protein
MVGQSQKPDGRKNQQVSVSRLNNKGARADIYEERECDIV